MSLPPSPPPEFLLDLEVGSGIFDRVVCGVDSTPESLEAVRQGRRLLEADGRLTVVSALELATSAQAGWAASSAAQGLEASARAALDAAKVEAPDASFRCVEGRADQVLLAQAEKENATAIAVGTHEISRPVGIALGSVGTSILHDASCSVLVARERPADEDFPRSIVVGVDGSSESATAAAAAFHLGKRFGVAVWPVAARDGKGFDIAAVDAIANGVLVEDGHPVDTLIATAGEADLLVVGSRGLHGVRALGSVSERVAHQAPCTVLVVRLPPP